MRRVLFIAATLLTTAHCAGDVKDFQPGIWHARLETPGGSLPFTLHLERSGDTWTCRLFNERPRPAGSDQEEVITVPDVRLAHGILTLGFPHYDSRIQAMQLIENGRIELRGVWRKRKGKDVWDVVPFRAVRHTENDASRSDDTSSDPEWLIGKWSTRFSSSDDPAVCMFRLTANGTLGATFLTTTGDYRYLCGAAAGPSVLDGETTSGGEATGRTVRLSTFDGAHAFLFTASERRDGSLAGEFWSGSQWHETWTAQRDENAELPDAFQLTRHWSL